MLAMDCRGKVGAEVNRMKARFFRTELFVPSKTPTVVFVAVVKSGVLGVETPHSGGIIDLEWDAITPNRDLEQC